MTNSDGGFQFDFQHPEEPSKPVVPPVPPAPATQATQPAQPTQPVWPAAQPTQAFQPVQPTQATQSFQPAQPTQPTQAVPSYDATAATQAFQPIQFGQPTTPAYSTGATSGQTVAMPAAPAQAMPAEDMQATQVFQPSELPAAAPAQPATLPPTIPPLDQFADEEEPEEHEPRHQGGGKKNTGKTAAKVLLCIAQVLGLAFGGIYWYVGSIFNTGEMGSLAPPESGADALVPDELSGTMNILVLGIDYSTEDAVKRDPIGQTDMILYVRVNGSDHTMTMLQIPRDTLVGEIGGSAGKINGIFANSADKENRVNTLAQYITKVFGLPIDDYVTIDMDSLREIVDVFGGIEVYVPVTMEYDGSRPEQGWRVLMGAECEFFLRQRKDTSATPRGDIDRLANQQYFYSALFRRVRTATVGDIIKLTPVVQKYINTSLNFMELVQLGMSVLSIPSENIIIGRLPVARGELYNGQDVMVCAKAETAEFLNEYFRPADDPLAAQQIGTPDWGTRSEVIGAEVRRMGEVDAVGGSDANAPADAQQAAQQANAASVQQPAA